MAVEALIAGVGALLVLVFVFASWMAIVPMLMAIVAIPTTFLAVWPLASATDVSVIVKFLIALVGLAIAIDYALLVVVRWREERQRGADRPTRRPSSRRCSTPAGPSSSAARPSRISLLALVVLPVPFLRSIGIAGMLIPLVSVAVAITLLPVVLATIGPRLDRRARPPRGSRQPRLVGVGAASSSGTAGAAAILSTAVLAGARLRRVDDPARQPAGRVAGAGRARPAPALEQLDDLGHRHRAAVAVRHARPLRGARAGRRRALQGVDGVRAAIAPADWRRDGTSLVSVIPTEDGNSPAGRATLDRVRARRRPATS